MTFLRSHEWVSDKAEAYGTNGILTRVHCKNCGLQRIAVVTEIRESAKRAEEYRRKLVENAEK